MHAVGGRVKEIARARGIIAAETQAFLFATGRIRPMCGPVRPAEFHSAVREFVRI
jgi:hypothetical protein